MDPFFQPKTLTMISTSEAALNPIRVAGGISIATGPTSMVSSTRGHTEVMLTVSNGIIGGATTILSSRK